MVGGMEGWMVGWLDGWVGSISAMHLAFGALHFFHFGMVRDSQVQRTERQGAPEGCVALFHFGGEF